MFYAAHEGAADVFADAVPSTIRVRAAGTTLSAANRLLERHWYDMATADRGARDGAERGRFCRRGGDGGECIFCQNYEVSINGGYRRIDGYTAFDGRLDNTLAQAVPGSGPVRGVWLYNGDVFAWRDNAGGTALVMHKATAGGWWR